MAETATREAGGPRDDDGKDRPAATDSQSEASATHKTENLVSLDSDELDEVEE